MALTLSFDLKLRGSEAQPVQAGLAYRAVLGSAAPDRATPRRPCPQGSPPSALERL